jgi:hypothetical protein
MQFCLLVEGATLSVSGRSYLKMSVAAGAVQGLSATISRPPQESITKRKHYYNVEKTGRKVEFVKRNYFT